MEADGLAIWETGTNADAVEATTAKIDADKMEVFMFWFCFVERVCFCFQVYGFYAKRRKAVRFACGI